MNFRLALFLCLSLAALPLLAAEESSKAPQEGWLKRVAGFVWPFHSSARDSRGATAAKEAKKSEGKSWKHLAPSLTLEPIPLKLSVVRTIKATLRLANRGNKLVQLDFPTTQRVEFLVKDHTGKMIEQWSEDQAFQNEPTVVTINPNERLEFSASISARDLKAGQAYTVEGFFPNFDQLRTSKTITPEP